jgi:NADP-dependent 3-hydroxy acid dehydrogenase YdfG
MTQGIKDKVVVIMGASSGLGETTARPTACVQFWRLWPASRGPTS